MDSLENLSMDTFLLNFEDLSQNEKSYGLTSLKRKYNLTSDEIIKFKPDKDYMYIKGDVEFKFNNTMKTCVLKIEIVTIRYMEDSRTKFKKITLTVDSDNIDTEMFYDEYT